ncbi:MAG: PAS domain S-box protein [Gammaproteobacteria bacterium]|nr:MAG: PAS domain S-box protein [Gammaproteobacteria bacterium]
MQNRPRLLKRFSLAQVVILLGTIAIISSFWILYFGGQSNPLRQSMEEAIDAFFTKGEEAVKSIAGDRKIIQELSRNGELNIESFRRATNKYLSEKNESFGASIVYILNKNGTVITDSFPDEKKIMGKNYSFRPYFTNAISGKPYTYSAFGYTTKKKGIYFSAPIHKNNKVIAVAVVKFDGGILDKILENCPNDSFITTNEGVIFSANRSEFQFKSLYPLSAEEKSEILQSKQFGNTPLQSADTGILNNAGKLSHKHRDIFSKEIAGHGLKFIILKKGRYNQHRTQTNTLFISCLWILVIFFILSTTFLSEKKSSEQLTLDIRKKILIPVTVCIISIIAIFLSQAYFYQMHIKESHISEAEFDFRRLITLQLKSKYADMEKAFLRLEKAFAPEKMPATIYNSKSNPSNFNNQKLEKLREADIQLKGLLLDNEAIPYLFLQKPIFSGHRIINKVQIVEEITSYLESSIMNSSGRKWLIYAKTEQGKNPIVASSFINEEVTGKILSMESGQDINFNNTHYLITKVKIKDHFGKNSLILTLLTDISDINAVSDKNLKLLIIISVVIILAIASLFWKFLGNIEHNFRHIHESINAEISAHIQAVGDLNREMERRKEAEEAIEASYNKMMFYFDNSPMAHVWLSTNQIILDWNYAAENLFGYKKEDIIGDNFFETINSGNILKDIDKSNDKVLKLSGGYKTISECMNQKGEKLFCRWIFTPIFDNDLNLSEIHAVGQDLTKQVHANEQLEINATRYRTVIDSAAFGIVCFDEDYNIKVINNHMREICSIPPGKEITTIADIFPENYIKTLQSRIKGFHFYNNDSIESEDHITFADRELWLLFHMSLTKGDKINENWIQCVFLDISDRKKTEHELVANETLVRNILENMIDTYYRVDRKGRFTMLSASAKKLLRADNLTNIIGTKISSIFEHAEDFENINRILKDHHQVMDFEFLIKRVDNTKTIVNVNTKRCFDNKGVFIGFEGLLRDISDRKAKEKEKSEMQTMLLQSDKMASLGQLSAGIAHEINNPVGYISSNLTTLRDYIKIYEDIMENLEKSRIQTDKSTSIKENQYLIKIDEIIKNEDLDFIRHDIFELVEESLKGTNIVRDIVHNLKSFARVDNASINHGSITDGIESAIKITWNQIKYKCEIIREYEDIPDIRANHGQLNQVWMNLIINASHAVRDDIQSHIRISVKEQDNKIHISFTDNGIGIPEENLSKLFNPFFTTKEVGKGTGLGLSIAFGIINKHKGEIYAESTLGEGTTIHVVLPFNTDDEYEKDI